MFNMGNMMKQAQAMQDRMQKIQQEIATMEMTGEAGGGQVKVTMTGEHEVRRVEISPEVYADDKEICEDLIAAACNDACRRIDEESKNRMAALTAGLKLPAGFKLPF